LGIESEIAKEDRKAKLAFMEEQLSAFYWPIYLRLQKDNVMWKRVKQLHDKSELPESTSDWLEKKYILKNHDEILNIIDSKFHLADANENIRSACLSFVKHVSIYHLLRNNEELKKLNPIHLDEPYPKIFFELIEGKLNEIQKNYNKLQQSVIKVK
jgi:hypothetical protein